MSAKDIGNRVRFVTHLRRISTFFEKKNEKREKTGRNLQKSPLTYNIWKCYNVNGNQISAQKGEKPIGREKSV